jgi:TonB family protein
MVLFGLTVAPAALADDGGVRMAQGPQRVAPAALAAWWVPVKASEKLLARQHGNDDEAGCVTVGFMIDSDGYASQDQVLSASPDHERDAAALKLVRKLRYDLAAENTDEVAVATWRTLTWGAAGDDARAAEIATPCAVASTTP